MGCVSETVRNLSFLKTDGRMLSGEQKEPLKLPDD